MAAPFSYPPFKQSSKVAHSDAVCGSIQEWVRTASQSKPPDDQARGQRGNARREHAGLIRLAGRPVRVPLTEQRGNPQHPRSDHRDESRVEHEGPVFGRGHRRNARVEGTLTLGRSRPTLQGANC